MRRILVSTLLFVLAACGRDNGPAGPSIVPPPPSTGGSSGLRVFEMTFAFDAAACHELPEPLRNRTFTTTLGPGASAATLTGATFVPAVAPYSTWNVLYTKFSDKFAEIWFQDPPIWEALSDESYLVIFGDAHGEIDAGTVTLPFWARVEYCPERELDGYPECEVAATTCESRMHQLTLRLK